MIDGIRKWSYAHPRARWFLREGWGLARRIARATRIPGPFEPAEFRDLRRLGETVLPQVDLPSGSPRVLFLSMRGWSTHILWELTFAHAAKLAGAEPVFATCVGRLPVCDAANLHSSPPMPCFSCGEYAETALGLAGFRPFRLKDLVDVHAEVVAARARVADLATVAECEVFVDQGIPLGRQVRISVAWFLARGSLPETPMVVDTYRRFLVSGQVVHRAFVNLLDETKPARIFCLNGTFFAEAILRHLSEARGIGVTTYEQGFMTDSVVMASPDPAPGLLVEPEAWEQASRLPLTDSEARLLDNYLRTREDGGGAADGHGEDAKIAAVRQALRLNPGRPLIVLFSNVIWDSAVQEQDIGFASISDWILSTLDACAGHPSVDLVIRIHPSEMTLANHKTEERMADLIADRYPVLPANVRVVAPGDAIDSYALMSMASVGLVYTSTTGLEMAVRGVPVVVAARTHYRGRGFTFDVDKKSEYWNTVEALLSETRSDGEVARRRQLSRRYAYLFFFRFMQHLDLIHDPGRGRPRLTYTDVEALKPGRNAALDRLVAGVMYGQPVLAPLPEGSAQGHSS